jgi:predicted acyltransferase
MLRLPPPLELRAMPVGSPPPLPDRLRSLDALRGFDMFWIVGGDALVVEIAKWYYGTSDNWVATQLEHAEWEGFRFYDLIFPLFLFMVGAVIPFSIASLRRRGASNRAIYGRIIRRTVLLFVLGLLYYGFLQFKWIVYTDGGWAIDIGSNQRVTGVLQRIAIGYGIAALISLHTEWRGQLLTIAAILLGYQALMAWVPNPDTGKYEDLTMEGNLAGWIDRHYLPGKLSPDYYGDRKTIAFGDNEGLLSTIPAVATALLGVVAGRRLIEPGPALPKALGLAAIGGGCLALGYLWSPRFPIIKNLWTSSFVLVAAGWSFLLLSVFYGVIDGLKWRAWAFPFVVIGMNAITIYFGCSFIDFDKMSDFFFGGVARLVGDGGPIVRAAGVIVVEWVFLYILYRKRMFLRV